MSEGKILLVEDNPDDVDLTLRSLKRHKILNEVVVARDGAEALDWLFATGQHGDRDPEDLPAVVLLDLKLPKVDGFEVLRSIRGNARTRLLPVVILTTSNEQADITNGYELRCNSYVRKPVDFNNFAAAVRDLGLYWLVTNQPPPNVGGK
jgi:CheY-like chemotaxis protein